MQRDGSMEPLPVQTFQTPEPVTLTVDIGIANVHVLASDRRDSIVSVQPSDPDKPSDVSAARQTSVEHENGVLSIRAPKGWQKWAPWGGRESSVDVRVEIPTGSSITADAGVGSLRTSGRVGVCRFHAGVGSATIETAGDVEIKIGMGDVTVDEIEGRADIKTAGAVNIGRVAGSATIRNSNGETFLGTLAGEARVHAANGAISVGRALANLVAKTSNGAVRIDEVAAGEIVVESALGGLEIGVRDGVSVWLDLQTRFGTVRNDLNEAGEPEPGEATAEIRARTSMGDITVTRCAPAA